VYWENGAQIIPPHDVGISAAIDRVGRVDELSMPELAAEPLGEDVVRRYLDGVRAMAAHPDASAKAGITIAYTPLHGVGAVFAERALAEAGFDAVHTEPSQREPDGDFPTVRFPNPEEDGAMDAVLALADEVHADVVFANDPDADRLAVALPDEDGDARYSLLSGDQIGALLADYLLTEGGDGDRMVATTIVSSQLLGKMAADRGVDYRETLTGFKWIANAAIDYAAENAGRFVVGYEEALGYSVGELVRDKDGVSAIVTFAEMVSFDRSQGRTVRQRLDAIYRRFGLYLTEQHSLVLPGADGLARIKSTMDKFRAAPPERIGDHAVLRRYDISQGDLGLPKSNVLVFHLDGNRRVIMRPSGTEPKLKSYYEVCEPVRDGEPMAAAVERAEFDLEALRAAHQALLD
jgi:phosphomannomutase